MKNNKGIGKYEILTVIVLLLLVFCILSMNLFGGVSIQKVETMKKSAVSFSSTVAANISSFHNTEYVYLQEVVDEGLMGPIKSTLGGGYCSSSESFVEIDNGMPYVTMKCNNVLIEKENFEDGNINAYQVSDWVEEKKKDDMEERVLYNCIVDGGMKYEKYYDELYLVYEINKEYGTNYYVASDIEKDKCLVDSKTFYRTKKVIK